MTRSRLAAAPLLVLAVLSGLLATVAPPAAAASSLIQAGPSRSTCAVVTDAPETLAGLEASLATFEAATGATVTCVGSYLDSAQTWTDWADPWIVGPAGAAYTSWVAQDPSARQLVIQVNLIPQSLSNIADPLSWESACATGSYDAYATQLAQNFVAAGLGHTVIRLGAEMNGTWEYDFVGTTTQEQGLWATCFDHEVTAMRQVAGAHFLFDWNPNACTENIPYADYYPGNAYVDIVGLDLYDVACATPSTPVSFATLAGEPAGLNAFTAFANAQGKPLSLPEWGLTTTPGGDDAAFVAGVGQAVASGDYAFQEYFDTGSGVSEPIDSGATPLAAAAYRTWFAAPPAPTTTTTTAPPTTTTTTAPPAVTTTTSTAPPPTTTTSAPPASGGSGAGAPPPVTTPTASSGGSGSSGPTPTTTTTLAPRPLRATIVTRGGRLVLRWSGARRGTVLRVRLYAAPGCAGRSRLVRRTLGRVRGVLSLPTGRARSARLSGSGACRRV